MTRLKKLALTAGVFLGVFSCGQAWNAAEAKIAYVKLNAKGNAYVEKYDYGDNYTLNVYEPRVSVYGHREYRDEHFYFYVPGYLGYPHFGLMRLYPYSPYSRTPRY